MRLGGPGLSQADSGTGRSLSCYSRSLKPHTWPGLRLLLEPGPTGQCNLNPDFKDLNIFYARDKGSEATRVATRLVPGSLQYARDLTVTALLGKPPNLALTLLLPSTSSENLQQGRRVMG